MTTRLFQLIGTCWSETVTGTVSINGTTVFDGSFGGGNDDETPICTGSYTLDDSVDTWVPVTITVTGGDLLVGMFKWNWGSIVNPALSTEELAYYGKSRDEIPPEIRTSVLNKGGWMVSTAETLNYSTSDDPTHMGENRRNIQRDGVPFSVDTGNHAHVPSGSTLTFETFIFAS